MKNIGLTVALSVFASGVYAQSASTLATHPQAFIPQGYVVVEEVKGDLNKDGRADHVFMIVATDPSKIVQHEYRGALDRNRRGLVIVFDTPKGYQLAAQNKQFLSSENEDGGGYTAPHLTLDIKRGNLYLTYGHGRNGHWIYNFRYQNADFELIGYDLMAARGPYVERMVSINFSTKKMQIQKNINPDDGSGNEVFEETWKTFTLAKPLKLSTIKDLDQLEIEEVIGLRTY